jgi:NAD(P)-dependent dehydrogenase (short-subunit alcohol dehydrogenase family)
MNVRDLLDLSGRTALITGGGRGLGEQMATALAEAGATVVVCSRKLEACSEVAAQIASATQRKTHAFALDVSNPESIAALAEQVHNQVGQVDILVNNAGISWGADALQMPLEKWNQVMAVNATGSFLMTQQFANGMIQRGWGRIVNVASIAGIAGCDPRVMHAIGYHASKGAVVAMTKDLAVKWAHQGVTVNAIAPGFFPTKMSSGVLQQVGDTILDATPMRRFGGEDDLKGIVVYLASQASSYMTGQIIAVDGGTTAM